MKLKKIFFIIFVGIYTNIQAQGLKVTHMEGTYDLDGDGLKEFASIETSNLRSRDISVVRYYEIEQNGYQKMLWELQSPNGQIGNFVDVELGDLDGDGVPELITIANLSSNDQIELLQPVLFYYKWDGQSFSENPGSMINLSGGRDFIRANNFVLFDKDGDMNQEVAISLGSPLREVIILDINISEEWMLSQTLKPNGMSSGIGALYVASIDWNRDGFEEYNIEHIENSIFFNLDEFSEKNTDLPHMLSDAKTWSKNISKLGIENEDKIIIYDNSDVLSACRCWYNFIYYGHNPKNVSVLDGGLGKWKKEKKPTSKEKVNFKETKYEAVENRNMVKNKSEIDLNIKTSEFLVLDARSEERFFGKVSDPRKNVRSGSIPNSHCLPFTNIIRSDKTFKNIEEIKQIFNQINPDSNKLLVFSCGSGVSACILALAYSLVDNKYVPTIYDGSWAEYGKIE